MAETYTASVVGAGMGGKGSMRALAASERFELVAVADLKAEARGEVEAAHPGVRAFPDHGEMFSTCPTDVVCVSTWPPSHRAISRSAISSRSSGTMSRCTRLNSSEPIISSMVSPLVSCRSPLEPASLIVRIARLKILGPPG